MKHWMTAMAIVGALAGFVSSLFLGVGDAAFRGVQNHSATNAELLSLLVLILGFVAWVPARWVRIAAGLGMLACVWGGLSAVGGFFLPAAVFTAISAVLALCLKPDRATAA